MKQQRILVIEDEPHLVTIYKTKLEFYDYEVITATDGELGLETALREKPDLIVLDINLPKMDGMSVMHHLRQDAWGADVPIIILTNYDADDEKLKQIVIDQPAYYILKTDKTIDQVIQRINEVLRKSSNDNSSELQ